MGAQLSESENEHTWNFGGRAVTLLVIDRTGFRFHCWTLNGDLQVRFDSPFKFSAPDGREWNIEPEQPPTLAPLLELVQTGVSQIVIRRSGEVAISFSDGASIRSGRHSDYDAWAIQGEGEVGEISYECTAGGGSPWG
jgi:hypothetical protein